ncbi:unnamed protein product, partial [Ectocarpus sp. 12 AP-2014]
PLFSSLLPPAFSLHGRYIMWPGMYSSSAGVVIRVPAFLPSQHTTVTATGKVSNCILSASNGTGSQPHAFLDPSSPPVARLLVLSGSSNSSMTVFRLKLFLNCTADEFTVCDNCRCFANQSTCGREQHTQMISQSDAQLLRKQPSNGGTANDSPPRCILLAFHYPPPLWSTN